MSSSEVRPGLALVECHGDSAFLGPPNHRGDVADAVGDEWVPPFQRGRVPIDRRARQSVVWCVHAGMWEMYSGSSESKVAQGYESDATMNPTLRLSRSVH